MKINKISRLVKINELILTQKRRELYDLKNHINLLDKQTIEIKQNIEDEAKFIQGFENMQIDMMNFVEDKISQIDQRKAEIAELSLQEVKLSEALIEQYIENKKILHIFEKIKNSQESLD